jgi:thiol-disulfide isomerase/thioredoxin
MKKAIYFSTQTCAPCKALKPIVQHVSKNLQVPVQYIDAQIDTQQAAKYSVNQVPTIVILEDDTVIRRHTGLASQSQIQILFS